MTVGVDMPWTKMLKPELLNLSDGELCLKQSPEDLHRNHNGDMHAGVLFSMTEMAGMGVVMLLLGELASSAFVVVKNINIGFGARAQGPISFSAKLDEQQRLGILEAFKRGDTVEEQVQVEARDQADKLVSSSVVTTFISPKR